MTTADSMLMRWGQGTTSMISDAHARSDREHRGDLGIAERGDDADQPGDDTQRAGACMLAINPPQTVQQQESHGRPDGPMHAIGALSRKSSGQDGGSHQDHGRQEDHRDEGDGHQDHGRRREEDDGEEGEGAAQDCQEEGSEEGLVSFVPSFGARHERLHSALGVVRPQQPHQFGL